MSLEKRILVLSKNNCKYCDLLSLFLHDYQYDKIICDDIDKDILKRIVTGISGKHHNTFPMVFIDGVFIGGYDDTVKYMSESIKLTSEEF